MFKRAAIGFMGGVTTTFFLTNPSMEPEALLRCDRNPCEVFLKKKGLPLWVHGVKYEGTSDKFNSLISPSDVRYPVPISERSQPVVFMIGKDKNELIEEFSTENKYETNLLSYLFSMVEEVIPDSGEVVDKIITDSLRLMLDQTPMKVEVTYSFSRFTPEYFRMKRIFNVKELDISRK